MTPATVSVFYNPKFGYIIASYTYFVDSVVRTVINPVLVGDKDISSEELGQLIQTGLAKSKNVESVSREEIEDFYYWHSSGIKSFSRFSREFRNIKITEENQEYAIVELAYDEKGGYKLPRNPHRTTVAQNLSRGELGKIFFSLFSEDKNKIEIKPYTFQTLNEKTISFIRPSDSFLDHGDGHTDAYQVFEYEEIPQDYIAFLIDNGYSALNEKGIQHRWQDLYGDLLEFDFHRVDKDDLKYVVSATTATSIIHSHFYIDGDALLEVLLFMDTTKTTNEIQETISVEYNDLLKSIQVSS